MTKYVTSKFDANDILEYAADSILVTDCDLDGPGPTIIYVNQSFEKMTGWKSKGLKVGGITIVMKALIRSGTVKKLLVYMGGSIRNKNIPS